MEHSSSSADPRQLKEEALRSTTGFITPRTATMPGGPQQVPGSMDAAVSALAVLLAGRADAAEVLAAVAAQLPPPTSQTPQELNAVQPGMPPGSSPLPPLYPYEPPPPGMPISSAMAKFELRWLMDNGTAAQAAAAEAALEEVYEEERASEIGDVYAGPTVTWEERDAKLRAEAVLLSPSLRTTPQCPVKQLSLTSAITPKPLPPLPSPLLDADDLPASYQASSEMSLIRQTLSSPMDLTLSHWFTRALYVSDVVSAWDTWSDPSSPPHRDAPDALAAFAESSSLDVPSDLLSADPDIAATAWDHYRGMLINALNRALVSGSDWRQVLRHLIVRYKHPQKGHPRLLDYVAEALQDPVLLTNPPLHADVIVRQLDESFSANSTSFKLHSFSSEWDQTTERREGEDCISLSRRVTKAYLRKLGDASITAANVFDTKRHLFEINRRFADCLMNDPHDNMRGEQLCSVFVAKFGELEAQYADGELATLNMLSCVRLARVYLGPAEENFRRSCGIPSRSVAKVDKELPALPPPRSQFAPPDSYHRPEGRGSRARRSAQRAGRDDLADVDER
jgi:hypothetical protein